ncbi:MAG: hypothetical protein ACYSW6_10125 [Planctomycetota bacterium]
MSITSKEVDSAIDQARVAKLAFFSAAHQLAIRNKNLEAAKATAIVNGIEGKNAEQRSANLRILLEDEYNSQALLQQDYDEARHEAELAELELTRIKLTIRLMELATA